MVEECNYWIVILKNKSGRECKYKYLQQVYMGYSIPSLVWFEQLVGPIKKNYLKNSLFEKFANFLMKT